MDDRRRREAAIPFAGSTLFQLVEDSMDIDEAWRIVDTERGRLADLLDDLVDDE